LKRYYFSDKIFANALPVRLLCHTGGLSKEVPGGLSKEVPGGLSKPELKITVNLRENFPYLLLTGLER
jgi:hypothetical protein